MNSFFIIKKGVQITNDKNIIVVYKDAKVNMCKVKINNTLIMEGNTWDFHNECHGDGFNFLPMFNTYQELVNILQKQIIQQGLPVEIVYKNYIFTG